MTETHMIISGPCPVTGKLRVPGDKSISHRAAILGAMANGGTTVHGYAPGGDCKRTLDCIAALGAVIEQDGDTVAIHSPGIARWSEPDDLLDAGNSGTTIRLLTGAVAGSSVFAILSGDTSLTRRPMRRVVEPLTLMGARILGRGGGAYAPLAVAGSRLDGIEYDSPVASAQVKTAILLAGLSASGRTSVCEPALSRDHTERILPEFGVELLSDGTYTAIEGGQIPRAANVSVPGDFSSAAFLLTAATLCPDSRVTICGVGLNPTRTGLLDILSRMGASISVEADPGTGEPVGRITTQTSTLRGIEIPVDRIVDMIDELPLIALAACLARGQTVIRGARELRVKESDRIATTTGELARMGARISELPDGLEITGPSTLIGTRVFSHGDHRLAMMLSVAGLAASGQTVIHGADAASVSYPGWWEDLRTLGGSVHREGE